MAVAFAILLTTNDANLDNQPADAGRRAATLATPALAQQLRAAPPPGNPGASWLELERHNAYTRSTANDATESGAPPDSQTSADRAVSVYSVPTSAGWTGPATDLVIFVHLTRPGPRGAWSVNDYSVQ